MALIQNVAPQAYYFPIWIEYVRALGTPIAALLGAIIAGVIAYRQMRTATNKLKLDLFEKRIIVYTAAVDLISTIGGLDHISEKRYDEILASLNGALWLLDRDAEKYLQKLRLDVREQSNRNRMIIKADDKLTAIKENKILREHHTAKLREIFAPFLQLGH
jgi:hypothetical protein